jgi:hypothetical protein
MASGLATQATSYKGCLRSQIRGAKLNSSYRAEWFDPRNETWRDAGNGTVRSRVIGIMMLPDFPGGHRLGTSPAYTGPAPPDQGGRRGN